MPGSRCVAYAVTVSLFLVAFFAVLGAELCREDSYMVFYPF